MHFLNLLFMSLDSLIYLSSVFLLFLCFSLLVAVINVESADLAFLLTVLNFLL